MELCFFHGRARMRAEGVARVVRTLRQPLLGLPIACGQQGLQGFFRSCQEQGLLGGASHQECRPKGSGQPTAS